MAHTVASTVDNPAGRLRSALDAAELAAVAPSAQNVEALLLKLDEIQATFAELETQGVDLRAERVRWENLTRRLASRPQLIARPAAALPGGLAALRARHGKPAQPPASAPADSGSATTDPADPGTDAPWWRADLVQARRRRRVAGEIVAILVGVPLLLGGLYWLVTTLFPPDPAAVATIQSEAAIDAAVEAGDATAALPEIEAAFANFPQEGALAVWVAVLARLAGDEERAAEADAAADALFGEDRELLLLTYSDHYARIGDPTTSLDFARRVIELNPESAQAWYHQGRAAEMLQNRALALSSLDRAATLADADSPELAVNARFLYAQLLQQPDFAAGVPLTATQTLTATQALSGAQPVTTTPAP